MHLSGAEAFQFPDALPETPQNRRLASGTELASGLRLWVGGGSVFVGVEGDDVCRARGKAVEEMGAKVFRWPRWPMKRWPKLFSIENQRPMKVLRSLPFFGSSIGSTTVASVRKSPNEFSV